MRAILQKALPRPMLSYVRRVLGWGYWSRAVIASLLPRAPASAPADTLDCIVATNEHGAYCVPRSCRAKRETQTIMQSRVWEPRTLDLLCGVDPDGDIVHAGTFFGDFIPALARSRRNGALVWAFEPGRENYRCSQITVLLNDLDNVVLTHAALAESGGEALLAINDRAGLPRGGASHIVKDPAKAAEWGTEKVTLTTVDDTVGSDRKIAAIQFDVEGHEQYALAGALRTIERCRPLIILESLPQQAWFDANLAPLGYTRSGSVYANSVYKSEALRAP